MSKKPDVCKHGGLRRKCDTCDAWDEVSDLRSQVGRLKARLEGSRRSQQTTYDNLKTCERRISVLNASGNGGENAHAASLVDQNQMLHKRLREQLKKLNELDTALKKRARTPEQVARNVCRIAGIDYEDACHLADKPTELTPEQLAWAQAACAVSTKSHE